jgi:diguanylate cyclase (GGDEF)-like protein
LRILSRLSRLPALPVQALLLGGAVLAMGALSSWQLQRHLSEQLMQQALSAEQLQVQADVAQFNEALSEAERSVVRLSALMSDITTTGPQARQAAARFDQLVRRDADGAWRSRVETFRPGQSAGLWLPASAARTEASRAFFAQAQTTVSLFGLGVSSGILENTWVLPLSGGELIFWPAKPTFIRDAPADLDYRSTDWVQLTAPALNPAGTPRWTRPTYDPAAREWLISVVAPFRQSGQWAGSVGHDLLLRDLLRWLIRLDQQTDRLTARALYVVSADGHLLVQGASTAREGARLPASHRRVLAPPPGQAEVFSLELGADHLLVARLPRLNAIAVYKVDGSAIQALVGRELRALHLGVALFMGLLLLLGLLLVSREISFRRREQRSLEQRNRDLELQVQARTQELAAANQELSQLAAQDALTGVGNRRSFEQALAQAWAHSRRRQEPIALVMVDVDHFKQYNDSLGHPAGDDCLRQVAALLQAGLHRPEDRVFRYGGEEFVLLLTTTDVNGAVHCSEQLRRAVEARALPHPHGVVTISLGVASTIPDQRSSDGEAMQLLARADSALYRAKEEGRNRLVAV